MNIILLHKQYNEKHLTEVSAEMKNLGVPEIRAIWSEVYGAWMAVEGSHRIRAAYELGLTPQIIDISNDETAIIELDGIDTEVEIKDFFQELQDDAYASEIINFD